MSAYNAEQSLLTAPTLNYYASLQDSETSNITQYLVTIPKGATTDNNSNSTSVLLGATGAPASQSNLMCIEFQYVPLQYVTDLAAAVGITAKNDAYTKNYSDIVSFTIQSESLMPALNTPNDTNGSTNYVVPVPVLNQEQKKKEYVILCNYTTTDLNTSDFSNHLTVYNAPPKFTIKNAYLEADEETPLLFVIVYDKNKTFANKEDYESFLFSVTTYTPAATNSFSVSKLLKPIISESYDKNETFVFMLQMPAPTISDLDLNGIDEIPEIHVAVRSILPFQYPINNGDTYYSVGLLSNTVLADEFPKDVACALTISDYNIYNDNYIPYYSTYSKNKTYIPKDVNSIDQNQAITFLIGLPDEVNLPGLTPESYELHASTDENFDVGYLILSSGDNGVAGGADGTETDFFLNPLAPIPSTFTISNIIQVLQDKGVAFTRDANGNIDWTAKQIYFRNVFTLFNGTISTTQYLTLPITPPSKPTVQPDTQTPVNIVVFQPSYIPAYVNVDYALSVEDGKDAENNIKYVMELSLTAAKTNLPFSGILDTKAAPAIFTATVFNSLTDPIEEIETQNFLYEDDGILHTIIEIQDQPEFQPLFVDVAIGLTNPNKDSELAIDNITEEYFICDAAPSQGTSSTILAEFTDFILTPGDENNNPSLTFAVVTPASLPLDGNGTFVVTQQGTTPTKIQSFTIPAFATTSGKTLLQKKPTQNLNQNMSIDFNGDTSLQIKSGQIYGNALPTDDPVTHIAKHDLYYYSQTIKNINLNSNQSLVFTVSNGSGGVAMFSLIGLTSSTTVNDFNKNFSSYVTFTNVDNSTSNLYPYADTADGGNEEPKDNETQFILVPVLP
uniref:Uncharacterized protein n=1 Tax=viral metagenome TaxID=1070528 RepID=A0A6C0KQ97_9ZZZZ